MNIEDPSRPVSLSVPRGLLRRKPSPLALEARIMFDGAAVATAADAAKPMVNGEAPAPHIAELAKTAAAMQPAGHTAAAQDSGARAASESVRNVVPPHAERAEPAAAGAKVLFVDGRIPDYQQVVAAAEAGTKVVVLSTERDGVQQIADALAGMKNVQSISIVSHGDSGVLLLGNAALHGGDLQQYQGELARIGSALGKGGEILLYGCDVGAGETGQRFIQSLADATGAVVGASTDATGNLAGGGNWDLEIATGTLTSAPVLDTSLLTRYDHTLFTTSVSTLAQLKAALATAAADGADDTITLLGDIVFTSGSDTINITITDGHKTTIVGAGHKIDGANRAQVVHNNAGSGVLELSNLTITNGLVSGKGGDSLDQGSNGAALALNKGGDALGGGIYNAGVLSVVNSTISNNKASGGGGGGGHTNAPIGGAGGGGGGFGGVGGGAGGVMRSNQGGSYTSSTNQGAGGNGTGGAGGSIYRTGGPGGSTSGGVAYTPSGIYAYIAGGGNGGTATLGGAAIGGGAGGEGYNGRGADGGSAAGAIYNIGTLVITGSTIAGNIAAAGGGGGSATGVGGGITNVGKAGDGGSAYGGIWNNGGTLKMDASSYAALNNAAGAGSGGQGSGTGNSPGVNGTAVSNASSAGADFNYTAPVLSGAVTNLAVNDNGTVTPFSGVTVSGSGVSMTITLDASAKGTFTAASLAASGFSTSDGGLTYTHAATTASALQAAVRSLVYQPTSNRVAVGSTEGTTFTLAVSDGVAGTTATSSVVATSVNDAPTLGANLTVPAILEDASSIAGATIASFAAGSFSDPDVGSSLAALAVVGNGANSVTEGRWQYSTNGGTNWYDIGNVSGTSALMLSTSTLLRFVPVADYNGSMPGLTVRAVDNTYGGSTSTGAASQTRVTVNVSSNGGSTSYSAATSTISGSVTPVNDAPVFTPGPNVVVAEDAGAQTIAGWATGISAGPANESGQTLIFTVTNSNNALFSVQPSIDSAGNLTFTGAPNANGAATITVTLIDNGGIANGGVDRIVRTFTISVTPVNDAPTGQPALSGSALEGQTLSSSTAGINDVDGLVGVTFNHQWQQSSDGGSTWSDITGATAATLNLGSDQVGKTVRDRVSFTDNGGTLETVYSAASATIAGVVPQVTSIDRATAQTVPASATSIVYTVTFNVAVTGVDVGDFTLLGSNGASGTVASVSGSGAVWQVTVNNLVGEGTLRLDLNNSGTGIVSGSNTAVAGGYHTGQLYDVDRVAPSIAVLNAVNAPQRVGDVVTLTLTVSDDRGTAYSLGAGSTVGGYALSNLVRLSSTTYTAQYTVTDGGNDYAAAADVPTHILLSDAVGNVLTYTTAISQGNDAINGNRPSDLVLSNASLPGSAGANATVGTLTTTDASVGDTFTYSLVSGAGDTDNARFVLVGNELRVNNQVLSAGSYSVRVRTTDSGGNTFERSHVITVSAYAPPLASPDTASATEAGGVGNATPGVNPVGNVLANDTSSDTKLVTSIAGGTLGVARQGLYGSLTLNADGSYTYVVNNSSAAVQALRTFADTLSETFTYTMADTALATSSSTLTVTIHGANDAPQANGTIALQQVTEGSPWSYTVPASLITDVDAGDTLTWTARSLGGGALPSWLSFDPATRTFSGTPPSAGDFQLTVTATDLVNASASISFTFRANSALPVAAPDTASATEAGGIGNATPGVNPTGNVLNNDFATTPKVVTGIAGGSVGNALQGTYGSLTLNADGSYIYVVNNANAAVQALRTSADTLTETFTYTMADGTLASSSSTLTVTLHGANDAPQANGTIPTLEVSERAPLNYTVPSSVITDVDSGDALTWTARSLGGGALPSWLVFDSATRTFSGMPPGPGDVSLTVTATDLLGASTSIDFTLHFSRFEPVASGDIEIAIEAGGVRNDKPGLNPRGNVLINDFGIDPKTVVAVGGGTLGTPVKGLYGTLTLEADGSYIYVLDNDNPEVQSLQVLGDVLADNFTYTMADGRMFTSTTRLSFIIHGANDAPELTGSIAQQQAIAGTAWSYTVPDGVITDPDRGDTLTWTAQSSDGGALPSWLTFDPVTRTFSGTPPAAGDFAFTLIATDSQNAVQSVSFTLHADAAPVVTPPTQVPDPQVPNPKLPNPALVANAAVTVRPVVQTFDRLLPAFDEFDANGLITQASPDAASPLSPLELARPAGANRIIVESARPSANGAGEGSIAPVSGSVLFIANNVLNDSGQREGSAQFASHLADRITFDPGTRGFQVVSLASERSGLRVYNGVEDQQVVGGRAWTFSVPADAFAHTDQNPGIILRATLADGRPLPGWLTFNASTGQFEGRPPASFNGDLVIKVQARDQNGRTADAVFHVRGQSGAVGAEALPNGRSGLTEQLRSAQRTVAWAMAGGSLRP